MVAASAPASTPPRKQTKAKARAAILKLLRQAVAVANAVEKNGHNALHSYDYARAEDMIREAKAILAPFLLAVMCTDSYLRADELGGRVLVTQWSLIHDEHGEMDLGRREWPLVADGRDVSKAFAAADTSSLAYFLRNLLQLSRAEQGGQIDDERKHENMPSVAMLMARIGDEFDRRGVPDDERAAESVRLIGKTPSTWGDFLKLDKALREYGAVSSEEPTS